MSGPRSTPLALAAGLILGGTLASDRPLGPYNTPMLSPESLANLPTNRPLPPEAYREISSHTLFVAIIGVLAVIMLGLVITTKRAHRRKANAPKPGPTTHTDAWTESGKRFDPSITEIDPSKDE